MAGHVLIRGALVRKDAAHKPAVLDILLFADRIVAIAPEIVPPDGPCETLDWSGLHVVPGLVNTY